MEEDKPLDPVHIGLLRPQAIVPNPDRLPYLVKQLRLVFLRAGSYPDAFGKRLLHGGDTLSLTT
jgi:hypothetical protein